MADYRIERDSLGKVRVPRSALYGAQTERARTNFPISGQRMPRAFIEALGIIKRAAAMTNRDLGLLSEERARAIIHAAERLSNGDLDDHFPVDIYQTGSGTSTNMNANEVLASVAITESGKEGVHPNDHVNMSQSSNDVIPTAMHVSAAMLLRNRLHPALSDLHHTLLAKSRAFDDVVKSGRTHLMDATPVRLGQEFGGYAAQVAAGMRRIDTALDELKEVALGGTATGSGINRHPEFPQRAIAYIAESTGIDFREAANHFEAQSAKDGFVMASGTLNTVAVSLMKIANDIRLLSSGPTSGIAEICLPAIQPGSSIMPGKVNPVMSEALMMVCARVMGNHTTITICGQHGNLELNVMMPVMAQAMIESIGIMAGACRAFHDNCLVGIEANKDRCKELLERNPTVVTALNAAIGYDLASEVSKAAVKEQRTVREVVLSMNLLTEAELDTVLDVRNMTKPGIPGR